MKRRTYVEPPMKFNVGLKKYEPDLPILPNKNTNHPSETEIRNFILILGGILLLLFIFYFLFNGFFG